MENPSKQKERTALENSLPTLHTIPIPEKIKIRSTLEGASSLQGKVNHRESRYYKINDFYNMRSDETLHLLPHFETYQQTTEYTCGAASALMVLNYMGNKLYSEDVLAAVMDSIPDVGTSVENMARFFEIIGWNVFSQTDTEKLWETEESFKSFLIELIDNGIPMMVDWLDWKGHWAVIIGIDECGAETSYDDVLIFADPYDVTTHFQDGYDIFPFARFFSMWMEGSCAGKRNPYIQPFVIAYPSEKQNEVSEIQERSRDRVLSSDKTDHE